MTFSANLSQIVNPLSRYLPLNIPLQQLLEDTLQIQNQELGRRVRKSLQIASAKTQEINRQFSTAQLDFSTLPTTIFSIKKNHLSKKTIPLDLQNQGDRLVVEAIFQSFKTIFPPASAFDDPVVENQNHLKKVAHEIAQQNFDRAYLLLQLLRFDLSQNDDIFETMYQSILQILQTPSFSTLTRESLQASVIHRLPQSRPHFHLEQAQLAYYLGLFFSRTMEDVKQVMHFFAKALAISLKYNHAQPKRIFTQASRLFISANQSFVSNDDFDDSLSKAVRLSDCRPFEVLIDYVELHRKFGAAKNEASFQAMAEKIGLKFGALKEQSSKQFQHLGPRIRQLGENPPPITRVEEYWVELQAVRDQFASEFQRVANDLSDVKAIRQLQKKMGERFQVFLSHFLLEDCVSLRRCQGEKFDFRGLGSFSREELCPYSDLECMILIREASQKGRMQELCHLLELQLISLGETRPAKVDVPVFSCLGKEHPEGLHIDQNPASIGLVLTPDAMARLQLDESGIDVSSAANMILTSKSIFRTDESLFEEYEKGLDQHLYSIEIRRHKRARQRIADHIHDFKEQWKIPLNNCNVVNLKNQFVKLLDRLMGDFGLYFNIHQINTLDLVDELIRRDFFTQETGQIIREAIAATYHIRVRLHLEYREQRELALVEEGTKLKLRRNETIIYLKNQEFLALKQAYWLVLVPLYEFLEIQNLRNLFS